MSESRSKFDELLADFRDSLGCLWYDGERADLLQQKILEYVHWLETNTPVDKLSEYGTIKPDTMTNKDDE